MAATEDDNAGISKEIGIRGPSTQRPRLPEIKTLRRTLVKWRKETLAYFQHRLTNGKTEGYNRLAKPKATTANRLAKLYQYKAFGYKSFKNYRLRLLNTC
jgi:transposase